MAKLGVIEVPRVQLDYGRLCTKEEQISVPTLRSDYHAAEPLKSGSFHLCRVGVCRRELCCQPWGVNRRCSAQGTARETHFHLLYGLG
jgi:hypothetical protein